MGRGGVVVNALDFSSEGWWFEAQFPPSCCFPSTQAYKMTTYCWGQPCDGLASHPEGSGNISVASCFRNRVKLQAFEPPWLVCDLPASLKFNFGITKCQGTRKCMLQRGFVVNQTPSSLFLQEPTKIFAQSEFG